MIGFSFKRKPETTALFSNRVILSSRSQRTKFYMQSLGWQNFPKAYLLQNIILGPSLPWKESFCAETLALPVNMWHHLKSGLVEKSRFKSGLVSKGQRWY